MKRNSLLTVAVEVAEDLSTSVWREDRASTPAATSSKGSDEVLAITLEGGLELKNFDKDASYPLTEDLKLPTGRRLFTVCLSMKDGERSFCALLEVEETGVMGMLPAAAPLLVVEDEPVGVGVMSVGVSVRRGSGRLEAAGMSMERCGRGR